MINQDSKSRKHKINDRSSSRQMEFITTTIFIRKVQHPDTSSESKEWTEV